MGELNKSRLKLTTVCALDSVGRPTWSMFEFEHLREFETICQNTIATTAKVEELTKKRGGKSREPVPFMRS
jgi:hypothetical protein